MQVVVIIENVEQTALDVCNLVRVSLPYAHLRTMQNLIPDLSVEITVLSGILLV